MAEESLETQVAVLRTDVKYIRKEIDDVKRLQYWLLGLFGSAFIVMMSILIGVVVK